jgi:hypothetical protein
MVPRVGGDFGPNRLYPFQHNAMWAAPAAIAAAHRGSLAFLCAAFAKLTTMMREVNPDFAKVPRRKCPELAPRDDSKSVSGFSRTVRRALTVGHCAQTVATLRPDPEMPIISETCWRTEMDSNRRSGLHRTCPRNCASIFFRNSPGEKLHRVVACSRRPAPRARSLVRFGQSSGDDAPSSAERKFLLGWVTEKNVADGLAADVVGYSWLFAQPQSGQMAVDTKLASVLDFILNSQR